MQSYEERKRYFNNLLQEFLSGKDDNVSLFSDEYTSDEYIAESESSETSTDVSEGGYTYEFKIYCKKEKSEESVPTKVVLDLMNTLLDKGPTLCTDNYCTFENLAHNLLQRQTHLIGTLKSNRKFNPKSVTEKKLKEGESVTEKSDAGVVVKNRESGAKKIVVLNPMEERPREAASDSTPTG
ncbi:hypothetical protein ILUMI_09820 [Ignelater luminosus]|uniref:PiggyBac transposable element-derived protein domain-containing protein n=1 Tax=Ignelater luminosus TaxID=2038154 RepID=A0A8K0D3I4_IGNLU|nr:hypothetical protein ILUMI_09820 [Ignelater luminosus]